MYIIDKNKDYYDYLGKTYGVDKTIVYDRRGSIPLTAGSFLKTMAPAAINIGRHYYSGHEGVLFVLEVGTTQYLFGMHEIRYKSLTPLTSVYPDPYDCKYELVSIFKDNKHYYDKEISIVPVEKNMFYGSNWRAWNKKEINSFAELREVENRRISNPILKDLFIPSLVKAEDIWKDLSNYISSKYNDKTITIVNSDVDKAVNHGFDKKTSFRNPIKL